MNIKSAEKKIRRYSFESKLDYLRKMSYFILDLNLPVEVDLTGHPQHIEAVKKQTYEFKLDFLSKLVLLNGEWKGPLNDFNNAKEIFKLQYLAVDGTTTPDPEEGEEGWDRYFLSMAFRQHHYFFDKFRKYMLRYKSMFELEEAEYIRTIINSVFSTSYEHITSITTSLFVCFTRPSYITKEYLYTILNYDERIINNYLSFFSQNKKEYIDTYHEKNREIKILDSLNPLMIKPLIRDNDRYYLPLPQNLFYAITESLLHRLAEESQNYAQFKAKFGKDVFESYIRSLLLEKFDEDDIIPEFNYTKSDKSPDFIVVKGNDLITIELKGTNPSIKLRSADKTEIIKQAKKAYLDGFSQCLKKEKLLRDKVIIDPARRLDIDIDNIYYMVITLEDFHIPPPYTHSPEAIDYIINKCNKFGVDQEYVLSKKPFLAPLHYFEKVLFADKRDLFDFMNDYLDSEFNYVQTFIR